MSTEVKKELSRLMSRIPDQNANITSGIYYADIAGKLIDLYKITYNPDNPELFDIECLTDTSNGYQFDKEYCIEEILSYHYRNVTDDKEINYKEKKNVELLLPTIYLFYSTITSGIRRYTNSTSTDESIEISFVKSI
jgi:hypothetical protein